MKKLSTYTAGITLMTILLTVTLKANIINIPVCVKSESAYFPASEKSNYFNKYDGTLTCWLEESNGGSIWIQKIDNIGNLMWAKEGVLADTELGSGFTADSDYPYIFSDKRGGALIIYRKRSFRREDIYFQKVNNDGALTSGPACISSYFEGYNYCPAAVQTGDNDIVIAWENFSDGDFDIHAQKIDIDGNKLWGAAGTVVCGVESDQRKPSISVSDVGYVFIGWLDSRNYQEYRFDLFANFLNPDGGSISYTDKGRLIFRNAGSSTSRKDIFYNHNIVFSAKNSFIIALENSNDNEHSSVYVLKVDDGLNVEWNLDMSSGSHQSEPLITKGINGGAGIIWKDKTANTDEIFAIVVDKEGNLIRGNDNKKRVSFDTSKDPYTRRIPTAYNQNGMYNHQGRIVINWVTTNTNKLFLTSINLADESARCEEALEIGKNVSEGEYTSITAHDNSIVAVYKQSDFIFATVRNCIKPDFKQNEVKLKLDNFPNPFNPSTNIYFSIPSDGFVRLSVFDVTGRLITSLVNENRTAGEHVVRFDGSRVSSGIYFYRLEANGLVYTKRMTMLK